MTASGRAGSTFCCARRATRQRFSFAQAFSQALQDARPRLGLRHVRGGKAAALTQAIQRLGGVGKTQLALEYAYRYASMYDGVWWLHAETPVTLASDYAALAPHLGVALQADQSQMVHEVRAALSQPPTISGTWRLRKTSFPPA